MLFGFHCFYSVSPNVFHLPLISNKMHPVVFIFNSNEHRNSPSHRQTYKMRQLTNHADELVLAS